MVLIKQVYRCRIINFYFVNLSKTVNTNCLNPKLNKSNRAFIDFVPTLTKSNPTLMKSNRTLIKSIPGFSRKKIQGIDLINVRLDFINVGLDFVNVGMRYSPFPPVAQ